MIGGAPGTVYNAGCLYGGWGVFLKDGGSVTNAVSGQIDGIGIGIVVDGGAGTIHNAGSIVGLTQIGIELHAGGAVTNSAGGVVSGATTGIYTYNNAATIYNAGSIAGQSQFGAELHAGGAMTNSAGGVIYGATTGIYISNAAGTVYNAGSIAGQSGNGVEVSGASGTVYNIGSISGKYGVDLLAGGTVTNAAGGAIYGRFAVMVEGAPGTVYNAGSIAGDYYGVGLVAGGSVVNLAAGTISGGFSAVVVYRGAGAVYNAGSIVGQGLFGVLLDAGGAVTNAVSGLISGAIAGIGSNTYAAVYNAGSIGGGYVGVNMEASGIVTNLAGGVISGGGYGGIYMQYRYGAFASGTVSNAGTIVGSTGIAVDLQGEGNNRVIIAPSAVFQGVVEANATAASNVLELASANDTGAINTGTISGIGSSFVNFGTVLVDAGAGWTLTGSNAADILNIGTGAQLALYDATLNVSGTVINDGAITIDPGNVTLAGLTGTGSTTIGSGSTLFVSGAISAGETIVFGSDGVFDIGDAQDMLGTISGFAAGDIIDLTALAYAGGATAAFNGNTLIITNGATAETLTFASGGGAESFVLAPDGAEGMEITVEIACFLAGTRIRTTLGDIAVEALTPAHLVHTPAGPLPVRWIGQSHVAPRFGNPLKTYPIRISAGALGEGLPIRDLLVSADHAIFLDGFLIQAGALVNGTSITRAANMPERITYYHVELSIHALLFAEGAMAESYVDNSDRMQFQNWSTYPVPMEPIAEMAYPRAKSARQVPSAIRRALAARATALRSAEAA